MTSVGDRMRLCDHPRTVPHPAPEMVPVIVWTTRPVVMRPRSRLMAVVRCADCELVWESN